MMYVQFLLSSRNVENLLFERAIDIRHGTVRFWWNRFGPVFALKMRPSGWVGCAAFGTGAGNRRQFGLNLSTNASSTTAGGSALRRPAVQRCVGVLTSA